MYRKFQHSIFLRIILFFAVVLLISFTGILVYSSQYLNQRAKSSWELESVNAINIMKNCVSEKNKTAKNTIASLYRTKYYDSIPEYMASSSDSIQQRSVFHTSLDEFLLYHFSSDHDIIFMAMACQKDQNVYALHRDPFKDTWRLKESLQLRINDHLSSMPDYGFTILPAYTSPLSPYSGLLLSMLCKVKNVGMTRDLGCLLIDFSLNSMEAELSGFFASYPSSTLYMVTDEGTILYDSSQALIGTAYPGFDQLKTASLHFQDGDENYIGLEYDRDLKLYFMAVQPSESIYSSVRSQKLFINGGLLLIIFVSLLSVFMFSRQYFHRIATICTAIREIQSGNLEIQLPLSSKTDELSLISENLNHMCTMLKDYIQKVYISQIDAQSSELKRKDAELKQKMAELYALQSQINPHFLYNTLESIRMRALSSNNRDVAHMVYLLSTLFKQSLKSSFVTSIDEELDTCRLYLELVAFRFSDNLRIAIQVEDGIRECGIIRHILQPIIENSIKHGLNPAAGQNEIRISICQKNSDILIQVTDNGKGIPSQRLQQLQQQMDAQTAPRSVRIGLANVHQRMVVIFGPDYGISMESRPMEATTITIRIPHMTVKEMEHHVQCFNC